LLHISSTGYYTRRYYKIIFGGIAAYILYRILTPEGIIRFYLGGIAAYILYRILIPEGIIRFYLGGLLHISFTGY
jgi:hypothetical protein